MKKMFEKIQEKLEYARTNCIPRVNGEDCSVEELNVYNMTFTYAKKLVEEVEEEYLTPFGKKPTMTKNIRSMTEEELADCLLNFPKEDILYDWCSRLCPHRIRKPYKCGIELEHNACPCDTRDIVIHWLKSEVKE